MPSVPTPSKAGIVETNSGERHIPSSVRADGTKRKEIKIRPGYKPPEDVEVYKNRTADAYKNRGSGGIPGSDGLKDDKADGSAASNKNAKRREARKKAKAVEEAGGGSTEDTTNGVVKQPNTEEVDPEVEREKKARNLKKKLKQAKELKEKKEGGGALLPEQFAKVIKINELIRELEALGFDSEGEPKLQEEEEARDP
jgi:partner of Y14 and mago protein